MNTEHNGRSLPKWIQRAHPAPNEMYACKPMCSSCRQYEALVIAVEILREHEWDGIEVNHVTTYPFKDALRRIEELEG